MRRGIRTGKEFLTQSNSSVPINPMSLSKSHLSLTTTVLSKYLTYLSHNKYISSPSLSSSLLFPYFLFPILHFLYLFVSLCISLLINFLFLSLFLSLSLYLSLSLSHSLSSLSLFLYLFLSLSLSFLATANNSCD